MKFRTKFSDQDLARINDAVRLAESTTRAEIVPVVARCSGRYDRAEDVIGLWVAAVIMIALWWLDPVPRSEAGAWGQPAPVWQLVILLLGGLLGFFLGAWFGSRVETIRRLFTPASQMREEVDARARAVFFDQRIHHTPRASGILLYVSLYERRAAVIADRGVIEQLGQPQVDALCRELTERLQRANVTDALCETIASAGHRLSAAFPTDGDDSNELADALVVLE